MHCTLNYADCTGEATIGIGIVNPVTDQYSSVHPCCEECLLTVHYTTGHQYRRIGDPQRAVELAEVLHFRQAGREAYDAGEVRAPALSAAVLDAVGDNAVEHPQTERVMRAYTAGFDQARNEDTAELLREVDGK